MCALTPGFLYRCKTEHELRREAEEELDIEIARAKKLGHSCGVCLIDRYLYWSCVKYGIAPVYKDFYLVNNSSDMNKKTKEFEELYYNYKDKNGFE